MVTFKVTGLKEAIAGLDELPKATQRNVRERVGRDMLAPMMATAQALAPQEKGKLVGSITTSKKAVGKVKKKTTRKGGQWRTAGGGESVMHMGPGLTPNALWQEHGTANMPPNPFMRPAFDQHAQGAIAIAADAFRDHIGKAAAKAAKKKAKGVKR